MAEPTRRSPNFQHLASLSSSNVNFDKPSSERTNAMLGTRESKPQSIIQKKINTTMVVGIIILLIGLTISLAVPKDNLTNQLIGCAVSIIIGGIVIRYGYKSKQAENLRKLE